MGDSGLAVDVHRMEPMHHLYYALRQLIKTPGFSIVAIVTIALGIGVNTAVFSVMNAVLLRVLPVPDAGRLVMFHLTNQPLSTSQSGYDDQSLSLPVFEAMKQRRDVFDDVVAFAPLGFGKVPVRMGAALEEARGELVSGNYFSGLGVGMYVGHASEAVLSYRWWMGRFGGSRDVLGKTLYVKGVPVPIGGVAAEGFEGSDPGQPDMDFWVPLRRNGGLSPWGNAVTNQSVYGTPNWLCLMMIGRLKVGISAQSAAVELTPLLRRTLAWSSPVSPQDRKPELILGDVRGIETLRGDYEQPLRVLMTMVGLVLAIASANVAMLLLLRNAARAREFALRRALGAGGRALFGQLISESLLLVTVGCGLAWIFAGQATAALTRWSGVNFRVEADGRVLWFTIGVSAIVALVFGLIPMRAVVSVPLVMTMKAGAATANSDRRRLWGRKAVVVGQIALCTILLCAGELLYETLRNLEKNDLGMRTAGLVVFGVTPQADVSTDAEAVRFHLKILEQIRAVPGVDAATVSGVRLGAGVSNNDGVMVDGRNPTPAEAFAPSRVNPVGSQFLQTLRIGLERGRDFDDGDVLGGNRAAIVNQRFVDRYLAGMNPLGHQVSLHGFTAKAFTIVGVARNSRYTGMREEERPLVYLPFSQVEGTAGMQYEIHAKGDLSGVMAAAERIVHGMDANVPLEDVMMQQDQFERSITQERLTARLAGAFGLLAMFLVLIGLYGTVSSSVGARAMEIGVRMALGAPRGEVLRMVLRESAAMALVGVVVGLPVAFGLARIMRGMLFGLSSVNPAAYLAAVLGVVLVTVGATVGPARRAAGMDPMRALRME